MILQWSDWLALAGIFILGAMSPGPSLAIIIKHSLYGGRAQGMIAALSHGLGIGLYAALSMLGIASVMAAAPWLITLLQLAGAGFLLYLAFLSLRSALRKSSETLPVEQTSSNHALAWREGFLIAFLNPKVPLFFVALFSQFLSPEQSPLTKVLVASMAMGIDTFWYLLVAFILSNPKSRHFFMKMRQTIDFIFGLLLLFVASRLLF